MGRQLFGTDGIRGVAGRFPLDEPTSHAVGLALGRWASGIRSKPEILLGMDTRESGPWLAAQVAGGLLREGARPRFAGLITTPGVAYLTRSNDFVAGVMISASHNPFRDNGIKVFIHSGFKLPDEEEHALEAEIFRLLDAGIDPAPLLPREEPGLDEHYLQFLASTFPYPLDGMEVALDCAHGAAAYIAPRLFERLGARLHLLGCSPNGRNINLDCGTLHVKALQETVTARGARIGVALDGDGDRAMFVSGTGKIVDGDAVLWMAARYLMDRERLPGATVVATEMSNLGLEKALSGQGIRLLRAPVGDKYVLEEMVRSGAVLGGEQSGHVIFRDCATTGDGLLTALRVLEIMRASGADLDELTRKLVLYPQRLVNVPVRAKKPFESLPEVAAEILLARQVFGDEGRLFVRYSGTERLARVMVEGPDHRRVTEFAARIAGAIQRALGSERS